MLITICSSLTCAKLRTLSFSSQTPPEEVAFAADNTGRTFDEWLKEWPDASPGQNVRRAPHSIRSSRRGPLQPTFSRQAAWPATAPNLLSGEATETIVVHCTDPAALLARTALHGLKTPRRYVVESSSLHDDVHSWCTRIQWVRPGYLAFVHQDVYWVRPRQVALSPSSNNLELREAQRNIELLVGKILPRVILRRTKDVVKQAIPSVSAQPSAPDLSNATGDRQPHC